MSSGHDRRIVGVIPAGAHGPFESGLDDLRPRVLLPILGTPLIGHVLSRFREAGVPRVTVCANSNSPRVRKVLGDGSRHGMDLYYFDDHTPRGAGGCVRDALIECDAQRVVVVEGTVLPTVDLRDVIAAHERSGAAATVVAYRDPEANGRNGDAIAPAGIYVFERIVLDLIHHTGYQDIKEVLLPKLSERGERALPFVVDAPCPRIGDLASYLSASEWILHRVIAGKTPLRGYRRRGEALIHVSARVEPTAELIGPVLIGPEAHLEGGAMVVGPAIIGAKSEITAGATVCRSIVWESARIERGAFVDTCVVTDGVLVRSGARCLNSLLIATSRPRAETGDADAPAAGEAARAKANGPGTRNAENTRRTAPSLL